MLDLVEVMMYLTFSSLGSLIVPSEHFLLLSVSLSDGYLFIFSRILLCRFELKRYARGGMVGYSCAVIFVCFGVLRDYDKLSL